MKGECQDIQISIHMLEFKEHSWYQFLGSNINFRCNYYSFIRWNPFIVENIVDAELEKGWLQGEVEGPGSQAET
jgi:hypothetical protein